jgi:serine/threonine-protein kinase RsbW
MRPSRKPLPASDPTEGHVEQCTVGVDHLEAVHRTLARFWRGFGSAPDERWRMLFEIAVAEVAANILEHALPPQITFTLRASDGSVSADFIDTGTGWSRPDEARRVVSELAERGRGLTIAHTAVDEVAYERLGEVNHWRLVKRR